MRIAGCQPELVVGTRVAETYQFDAGIGIKIDQAAVVRARGDTREDADAPVVGFRKPIDLLLENRPDAEVADQRRGHAAACRRGERDAIRSETQVVERAEM